MENNIKIFWSDLTPEKQKEILDACFLRSNSEILSFNIYANCQYGGFR